MGKHATSKAAPLERALHLRGRKAGRAELSRMKAMATAAAASGKERARTLSTPQWAPPRKSAEKHLEVDKSSHGTIRGGRLLSLIGAAAIDGTCAGRLSGAEPAGTTP